MDTSQAARIAASLTQEGKAQWIEALHKVLPWVHSRSENFVVGLLTAFERKGDLSEKQWAWAIKMADDAMDKAPSANLADIYMHL